MASDKTTRKSRLCGGAYVVLPAGVMVLAVILSTWSIQQADRPDTFKEEFLKKCENWPGDNKSPDCVKVWSAFEQAYVGRNACQIPIEAYDDLMSIVPLQPACDRVLFYSRTRELARQMSEGYYQTVEDSRLGSILADERKWCGEEGSNYTFNDTCPERNDCTDTPNNSFWRRISAELATVACGNTFVLLNGSKDPLYRPDSTFSTIEITKLTDRVKRLTVFLVPGNNVPKCEHESIKYLEEKLDPRITFICKEKTKSELLFCAENNDPPCGAF